MEQLETPKEAILRELHEEIGVCQQSHVIKVNFAALDGDCAIFKIDVLGERNPARGRINSTTRAKDLLSLSGEHTDAVIVPISKIDVGVRGVRVDCEKITNSNSRLTSYVHSTFQVALNV